MRVEIDDKSGFCFGVVRAITEAERALGEGGTVYSLGDIVHNRIEVQRLEQLGLRTVTHADMPHLAGCRLFIRAHGEPPTTYAAAREMNIGIIDATCPVVARLQRRVKEAHERMRPAGGQVVILGKRGHAEVVGLTGQVAEPTIVIERAEDLSLIDFARPVYFLSQTTQSIALFEEFGVLTETEVRSRYEVKLEKYNKILNIEIRAMKRLVRRDYLPAINRYAAKLANGITAIKNVLPEGDTSFMKDKLEKLVAGAAEINRQLEKLHELHRASLEIKDQQKRADMNAHEIIPVMEALRAAVDAMEIIVERDAWPVPTYNEILFYA